MSALQGILVVALEQAVAVPLCTARLAENGARVIKVERPEGDFARGYDNVVNGESAYFVWLNRGKESITLDIKVPADAAILERMIAKADVFIQNLAPGAAARAGFDSDELRKRHSRLITCDVSGYGEEGPWAEMKAYDFLIQCESGLASISGAPAEPGRIGVSVADIGCGINAHAAILEALYHRERTGEGSGVAVSLFDTLADWMSVPLLHHDYGGRAPVRMGMHHPSIAPYGAYSSGDGRQVVIAIQNEREWKVFCAQVLQDAALADHPPFASNTARCANRPALDARINAVFNALCAQHLTERLRMAKVAFGAVNSVPDLSRHAQLRRRTAHTPSGDVQLPASPMRRRGPSAANVGPVPALGEHTEALRQEFAEQ
jgi:crotonobetainyl-CoA:carnitine CoA-transferase CaiB-like acyl-CoA transferase